jgi:hypothetical protein
MRRVESRYLERWKRERAAVALTNGLRVILLGWNRGDCTLLDLTIVFGIFGMIQTNLKKIPKPLPVETNTSCRLLCRDVATKPAGIHMLVFRRSLPPAFKVTCYSVGRA